MTRAPPALRAQEAAMPETTTTTTTVRRVIRRPKPKTRLVKRVRKVTVRTAVVKGKKGVVRRKVGAAPVKRVEIIDVKPVRVLPAPTPVSELTVKERQRLKAPR
jgi:hypothetical protein